MQVDGAGRRKSAAAAGYTSEQRLRMTLAANVMALDERRATPAERRDRSWYWKLERGQQNASLDNLVALAQHFQVPVTYLLTS